MNPPAYTQQAGSLLISLGFDRDQLTAGNSIVRHLTHPKLTVSLMDWGRTFRLSYCGDVRLGDPKIPRRLISVDKPRWESSVNRWYQRAVFSLGEINRRREDEETREKQEREKLLTAIADQIPAGVDVTPEELHGMVPMTLDEENILSTANYYNSISLNLQGLEHGELVGIVARLKAFLKQHNIPHR